jgi:phosphatidate cytidylyltransferase
VIAEASSVQKRPNPLGADLATRVVSSLVLAIIALAGAWWGGWVAAVVVSAAVVVVHREWSQLTRARGNISRALVAGVVAVLFCATAGYWMWAMAIAILLAGAGFLVARDIWTPAGVLYSAVLGLGILAVRLAPEFGLLGTIFLFGVVWAADSGAFAAGRLIGGRKLWPALSPGKTWAGAIGGLVAGLLAGVIVLGVARLPVNLSAMVVCLALALISQAGDLFESWLKRRVGAKDSGTIIPGHGGMMDRVDGLVFAAGLAAAIGVVHGGASDIAGGLIAW